MKHIVVFLLIILTSSCSAIRDHVPVTIKELLPVGSTLRLTRALEIPADRTFIYIAHGKVPPIRSMNTVDIYQPYCMFRLHDRAAEARQVMPDQFEVTSVVEWDQYYGSLETRMPGGTLLKTSAMNQDNGGPSNVMYATVIRLRSQKQPEVKELVCGHWDLQGVVEPLTLKQMKSALGDLIRIEIKNAV